MGTILLLPIYLLALPVTLPIGLLLLPFLLIFKLFGFIDGVDLAGLWSSIWPF